MKKPSNYHKTDKPTTDITEENPKMLAEIKSVARFHPLRFVTKHHFNALLS